MSDKNLFSLDTPLIDFGYKKTDSKIEWTTRDAVEGVQIFGGIGSGKTSGSGRLIALKYLQNGFGGLVLTVKPDEKALWESYCKEAGRLNDLIVIEPGGHYNFNFLEYESAQQIKHSSITDNLLQVLKTVIKAGEEKDSGKSDDPFWENSLDMLIFNLIDLCLLAYKKVTIQTMYDIVTSLPKKDEVLNPDSKSHFMQALRLANENVAPLVKEWLRTQPPQEIERLTKDKELLEWTAQMHVPDAQDIIIY
ncbi:MAG: hypothetical protein M0D57_03045 [Sphingobacteriales bacterium JAD_PAG50586_3]|nr:MAG: hypothetical protein M0D57_03045 [Sphingobacteriales bacterium JAD_PAG50586_3]